jgi:hypothetical protein
MIYNQKYVPSLHNYKKTVYVEEPTKLESHAIDRQHRGKSFQRCPKSQTITILSNYLSEFERIQTCNCERLLIKLI